MYFPRCFFIRSVENITTTFSEFLFQYFRFFVPFLLSSLDINIVLLNFKETTLKYSPRQNFDCESINWCDQIIEELSLIQPRIIVAEKLMIIPLLTTVLYVGKTIMSRNTQKRLSTYFGSQKNRWFIETIKGFEATGKSVLALNRKFWNS